MVDATPRFTQAPGCEVSQMADGFVVYQADRERVHYLNPTASVVFDLCREAPSSEDIAAFLQDAFSLAQSPKADVGACLDQLLAEGLICPA